VKGRIAIGGAVAQKPGNAGHTWQFLQYLLGFRRLGYDVLLVDSLAGGTPAATTAGLRWVDGVMREHGLERSWTVKLPGGGHAGVGRRRTLELLAGCDLLLNVMGFVADEALLAAAPRRVFLDTDPGFAQMWHELGLADVLAGHDAHVTIGERIGSADCAVPACGIDWITTPQPVVLTAWPRAREAPRRAFTSVASWRGAYGPIDFRGRRYGLRVHEFRRFAMLPATTGRPFEVALSIDASEGADLALLRGGGWTLIEPGTVASTTSAYRSYIAGSAAELMVAKGIYVQSRSGWFSERSICYLASGRPVLAQDTGIGELYSVGRGLLTFRDLEEAAAGVEAIMSDYDGQAAAARELAEEHFDSDRVLTRLLERL
jgi:hypothetical protein